MEEYIAMYVRTYRILKGVAERLREDSSESGWFAGHACGGDEALAEQGLSDKELVLTEWNATACQVLDDDTVYKAAYLAKTIADTVEEPDVSPVLFLRWR
ncbi:hypothetical protein HFN20_02785 [Paenibacillus dendritiformis]|uniref:hypothetical protein n=1 Tax=Paenibacillus dendritiformis TaxID=130049 RepID=UPI00143D60FB|nr:hypothetical protein [Paenibacillus dendritiformis]NKI20168.1 hypothetical protein [Paenibacillus dendritiformis]NRF99071.1 hypothetical protein [Paenibacillus dendritiformis]